VVGQHDILQSHRFCLCLFHQVDLLFIELEDLADIGWERQKHMLGDEVIAGLLAGDIGGQRGVVVHAHVEACERPQKRTQLDDALQAIPA